MRNIFDDIRNLIERFDYSAKASAQYVLDAGELKDHHSRLKSLQLSFVFMLSVCPPQRAASGGGGRISSSAGGTGTTASQVPPGTFEGVIQQIPIQVGQEKSTDALPTTYKATLTLQPSSSLATSAPAGPTIGAVHKGNPPSYSESPPSPPPQQGLTDRLETLRKDRELKKKLQNLSRNPFFSKDSFRHMLSTLNPISTRMYSAQPQAVSYDLVEDVIDVEEGAGEWEGGPEEYEERIGVPVEGPVQYEYNVPTDEQAERDVDDILDYVSLISRLWCWLLGC